MRHRNSKHSLRSLMRRLIGSLFISIIGSWLLLLPLKGPTFIKELKEIDWNKKIIMVSSTMSVDLTLFLDFLGLSLILFGFFMAFYYRAHLSPRLRRLAELGEDRW